MIKQSIYQVPNWIAEQIEESLRNRCPVLFSNSNTKSSSLHRKKWSDSMKSIYNFALLISFMLFGLSVCGCQPGAGRVEIWVNPKSENRGSSEPIEVSVGQTINFDGQRILPGTDPEHAIKPLHEFTLNCDPEGAVSFALDSKTMTFNQVGQVTVWLIEMAPGLAHQSQEPVEEWDQFHQVEVHSNRLKFDVK